MRFSEILVEAATDVIYHFTGINSAAEIMKSGEFLLSRSTGNKSEEGYAPPGYDYFFSTTRSKTGDYHRYTGSGAVMFVLDGQWFTQRYKVKPVDYWDRSWIHSPDRTRESEDRVFSKTPNIPIDGVRAIHVYMKEQHEFRSPMARTILISAKQRGIPAYLYNDEQAWRLQDTRRAITVAQSGELLKGQQPARRMYSQSKDYLEPWLELIYKRNKADLSPEGEKLRHNLVYYGSRYRDEDSGLGNALSNERKPGSTGYDSATKLVQAMRKLGYKTPLELKNALCDKWDNIK